MTYVLIDAIACRASQIRKIAGLKPSADREVNCLRASQIGGIRKTLRATALGMVHPTSNR